LYSILLPWHNLFCHTAAKAMDDRLIFSSHSLTLLVDELSGCLSEDIFSRPLIVTPSSATTEWLQLELCKRTEGRALLGVQFASWPQALPALPVPKKTDFLAAAYETYGERLALHHASRLSECNLHGPENAFSKPNTGRPCSEPSSLFPPKLRGPCFCSASTRSPLPCTGIFSGIRR
jgi:hypothetical protein